MCRIEELLDKPVFCFTSDIEWSPEWAILEMLALFGRYSVPLTPFVTHRSDCLWQRYGSADMRPRVGLHPNFLIGSTHGDTTEEVMECVCKLWPEATSFRSHSFFDHSHVTDGFFARNFKYDSNLGLFLQPDCVPLRHNSGLIRFPVYWEDDNHWRNELPFELSIVKAEFEKPGLKVFNVHPLILAINTPNGEYYEANKRLYNSGEEKGWQKAQYEGKGVYTFLEEVLKFVTNRGYSTVYLHDLFMSLAKSA